MAPAGKSLETVLADTLKTGKKCLQKSRPPGLTRKQRNTMQNTKKMMTVRVWGDMIAGMFWPNDTTSDAGHYLGSRFKVNAALNLTCDLGGEVN